MSLLRLCVTGLLLVAAGPVFGQSAVVRSTRLIATTLDPVPGFPELYFAGASAFQPPFSQATLAQGTRVAFYGRTGAPQGAGFYRSPSTLQVVAPTYLVTWPNDPPVGVPFSLFQSDAPIADGVSVAFDGLRTDWFCDDPETCSTTGFAMGTFVSQGGAPTLVAEDGVLQAFDGGSVLNFGNNGGVDVLLDGQVVLSNGDTVAGYTIADVANGVSGHFDFRSGVGIAFVGQGTSGNTTVDGIWAQVNGTWVTVATTENEMPGFAGINFAQFGAPAVGWPAVANGPPPSTTVVFWGESLSGEQGIYRLGGGVVKVADTTDSVMAQGLPESIYAIESAVAIDGLEIAFTINNGSHLVVADVANDELRTVLSIGDVLRFGRQEYEVWDIAIAPNSFDLGNIVVTGVLGEAGNPLAPQFEAVFIVDADGSGIGGPGGSQAVPIDPTSTTTDPGTGLPISVFENAPSVAWIDPPLANGFTYTMTGGALFTAILDLPTGFDAPFEVLVDNQSLGMFGPGSTVDFGAGVASFTIRGISPAVDAEAHGPFAVQLEFSELYASFTVTPLEAPVDTDGDGLTDDVDPDDDNDDVLDEVDAFPLDPAESVDTDHDGIGNNADTDDDGDGMPDDYEAMNGFDPLDAADAAIDADGDGLSNLQEFQQGTDPHDRTDPRRVPLAIFLLLGDDAP